jgi:hypothetical protein
MERIARENYMMKRDNEVIYIIENKEWTKAVGYWLLAVELWALNSTP